MSLTINTTVLTEATFDADPRLRVEIRLERCKGRLVMLRGCYGRSLLRCLPLERQARTFAVTRTALSVAVILHLPTLAPPRNARSGRKATCKI